MRLQCLNVVPFLPHQIHADTPPTHTFLLIVTMIPGAQPGALSPLQTVVGLLCIVLSVSPSRLGPCVSQKPPPPCDLGFLLNLCNT